MQTSHVTPAQQPMIASSALLLFLLVISTFADHPHASSKLPQRKQNGTVRWSPSLEDIISGTGEITDTTTLAWCKNGSDCTDLTRIFPSQMVLETRASPYRDALFVWIRSGQKDTLDIFNTKTSTRTGHCEIGSGANLPLPSMSTRLQWTAGANILLTWSAGTSVVQANLYDRNGKTLFVATTDSYSISPSFAYLATFPSSSSPGSDYFHVYNLASGHEVQLNDWAGEIHKVLRLNWSSNNIDLQFMDRNRKKFHKTITLEKSGNGQAPFLSE